MAQKLFQKYPIIFYNGSRCLDLSARVKLQQTTTREPNLFYPLTLKAGLRPDSLADAYYNDAEMDWLLFLTNNIVDPYYQWYLDEHNFDAFIDEKYGSLEQAIEIIRFYRNNWASDPQEISPFYYDNTLQMAWRQYYEPVWGNNRRILSYRRKQEDWLVNTNRILAYDLTYQQGNSYTAGEVINIQDTSLAAPITGGGRAVTSNLDSLIIQHVNGNTVANSTLTVYLTGEDSNTIASSTNMTVVYEIIANSDARFWTPVTAFDMELEANEQKKQIMVVDKNYAGAAAEALRQALKLA